MAFLPLATRVTPGEYLNLVERRKRNASPICSEEAKD